MPKKSTPNKWFVSLWLAAITMIFCANFQTALALDYGWNISSFASDIKINQDSSIIVKETIVADYTNESHHGILRTIPVRYRDKYGNQLDLRYQVLSVKDQSGKNWEYEQYTADEDLVLKIGSADIMLNQPSTFVITYKIERAVTFFDDHDELYWNVTGTETGVQTLSASASITLPAGTADSAIKSTCYTGEYGSTDQYCATEVKNGTITYTTEIRDGVALNPFENLTIVAGFPKGTVQEPSIAQKYLWFFFDNWGYLLPIITFGTLFYLWFTRGKDPRTNRDTVMPIYTPPNNLTPSEIGTLIDEKVDMRDISSCIIDLAVRGYLKINETKTKGLIFESTKYNFEKLKNTDNDKTLKAHEILILDAIFSTGTKRDLDDLQYKFYKDLPDIREKIYKQLVKDGYFPVSPDKVRGTYLGWSLIPLFIFITTMGAWANFFPLSLILGIIISLLIVAAFANFMPAKTKKGVDTFFQIKGLEEYISTAEKDRIKFQEGVNLFEKLLPYAMTLGLVSKWTSAFAGIYKTAPAWYSSNDPTFLNHFSTHMLLNRMDLVSGKMASTFASSPRSASGGGSGFSGGFGGGGFSGGGFGGGGTGSW